MFLCGVQPRHAYRLDTCVHARVWCNVLWVVGGTERNRRGIKNTGSCASEARLCALEKKAIENYTMRGERDRDRKKKRYTG